MHVRQMAAIILIMKNILNLNIISLLMINIPFFTTLQLLDEPTESNALDAYSFGLQSEPNNREVCIFYNRKSAVDCCAMLL